MCGRFSITAPAESVMHHFDLVDVEPFPPRYNNAPTQPILTISGGAPRPEGSNRPDRDALLRRWGLIPAWAKNPSDLPLMINARSETAADKPAFRGPMRHGRILVPASGYYEWRRSGGNGALPRPFWIRPRDGSLLAFAGVASHFIAADGSEIDTVAILTTKANAGLASIHDRMPVIVPRNEFARWLDCRSGEPRDVADLLQPAPDDLLEAVAVSTLVNKVGHCGPEVQEPLADGQADEHRKETGMPQAARQPDLFGG